MNFIFNKIISVNLNNIFLQNNKFKKFKLIKKTNNH